MHIYTAKVSLGDKEIDSKSGNDLETLYAWMLYQAQGKVEHYSGYIINNETKEIVKKFRKCSID